MRRTAAMIANSSSQGSFLGNLHQFRVT
jgi:hypothetical protein